MCLLLNAPLLTIMIYTAWKAFLLKGVRPSQIGSYFGEEAGDQKSGVILPQKPEGPELVICRIACSFSSLQSPSSSLARPLGPHPTWVSGNRAKVTNLISLWTNSFPSILWSQIVLLTLVSTSKVWTTGWEQKWFNTTSIFLINK